MHTESSRTRSIVAAAAFALLAAAQALAQPDAYAAAPTAARRADLRGELLSLEAQHIADWAVHSGDHRRLPFIIVDKPNARAYAFDRTGRLLRSTPVLIGMAVGDIFPVGIADMDMLQTEPWQRITPAGRYLAEEGKNLKGQDVLWVDYENAIAIHRMPTRFTAQRRAQRMVSANPADHRITYGCINVPAAFYDKVVHRHFRRTGGIVYVLPDAAPLKTVFRSYDIIDSPPRSTPLKQSARQRETRRF